MHSVSNDSYTPTRSSHPATGKYLLNIFRLSMISLNDPTFSTRHAKEATGGRGGGGGQDPAGTMEAAGEEPLVEATELSMRPAGERSCGSREYDRQPLVRLRFSRGWQQGLRGTQMPRLAAIDWLRGSAHLTGARCTPCDAALIAAVSHLERLLEHQHLRREHNGVVHEEARVLVEEGGERHKLPPAPVLGGLGVAVLGLLETMRGVGKTK